jgi:uncharacterized protein YecA (UPF0149 family)
MRRSLADLRRLQAEQPAIQPAIQPAAKPTQSQVLPAIEVARNALCPCGSNQKYKRCCGRNAPAIRNGFAFSAPASLN